MSDTRQMALALAALEQEVRPYRRSDGAWSVSVNLLRVGQPEAALEATAIGEETPISALAAAAMALGLEPKVVVVPIEEMQRMRQRESALVAALRPFLLGMEQWDGYSDKMVVSVNVTLADLRRAVALVGATTQEEGEGE